MIKLDENLLVELGLGSLPKQEKTDFLKHMYETLEMRVGTKLAERMSDQQMVEFERFISTNDEQGAFHWLESNFPDYKDVVAQEFEKLKGEIRPLAPQIVAASQAQQQAGQNGQQPDAVAQMQQPQPAAFTAAPQQADNSSSAPQPDGLMSIDHASQQQPPQPLQAADQSPFAQPAQPGVTQPQQYGPTPAYPDTPSSQQPAFPPMSANQYNAQMPAQSQPAYGQPLGQPDYFATPTNPADNMTTAPGPMQDPMQPVPAQSTPTTSQPAMQPFAPGQSGQQSDPYVMPPSQPTPPAQQSIPQPGNGFDPYGPPPAFGRGQPPTQQQPPFGPPPSYGQPPQYPPQQ